MYLLSDADQFVEKNSNTPTNAEIEAELYASSDDSDSD